LALRPHRKGNTLPGGPRRRVWRSPCNAPPVYTEQASNHA